MVATFTSSRRNVFSQIYYLDSICLSFDKKVALVNIFMSLAPFSTRRHSFLLLVVFLIGFVVVYVIADHIDRNEMERRDAELLSVNRRAAFEFSESLDRFIYLMSGIRSYVNHAERFPTQEELQFFLKRQMTDLHYKDSLIVSFISPDHVFQYSFTAEKINPANLVGTSVRDIRSDATIQRLDRVMQDEQFHLFKVTNLVEGWVGIPIDFNVVRNKQSVGYIAAIADFNSIIAPIYTFESSDDFVFKFSVDGVEFDREKAYDGTKVYHKRKDPKYYKNYKVEEDAFVSSEVTRHGLTFSIGTAYINQYRKEQNLGLLVYGWYVIIVLFVSYSLFQLMRFKKMSETLEQSIATVESQKSILDAKNRELNQLVATKDKFFTIIGHDLRGPLTSIGSVVGLWNSKAVARDQFDDIMKKLGEATKGAANLLDNLLLWALVNTGQMKWNPEELYVEDLIQEVYFQLTASAAQKKVKLVADVTQDCKCYGDRNMLSTIVRNLVSNAIKFGKTNAEVKTTVVVEANQIVFKVLDKGKGLSAAQQKELFSLNKNTKGNSRTGTGLGLILVEEFVSRHSGTIAIDSEEGGGATFIVTLPVDDVK